ncbi:MAG: thioredoxin family protein [Pirellulales bacterium]
MSNTKSSNSLIFIVAVFAVLLVFIVSNENRRSAKFVSRDVEVAAFEPSLTDGDTVLIKFGATWCPPCRQIEGELDKLDQEKLHVKVVKVDVDENPQLKDKYGIGPIPHLMLVRGGKTLDEQLGYMSQSQLEEWIRSHQ